MKKILFLIAMALFSMPAFTKNSMKIVYFDNYPPFSWEENNKMTGILIDVVTEAIKNQMGIQISNEGYPWARAQKMVMMNMADAFITVPTPERRGYTEISTEPVISVTFSLFASKENAKIEALGRVKTISDLSGYKLINYIGSGWGKHNLGGMDVFWVPTLTDVIHLLANNKYDAFVDVSQVVRSNINRLGYQEDIIELPNVLDYSSFNLCIGKNSPYVDILPKFDETIRKMRESGKLQEIYDRYK